MLQTIRSVVLEVQPESASLLQSRVESLRLEQEAAAPAFSPFKAAVPSLHFMSMTIFRDDRYDPILVIEVNFDGPPGPFWAQLEAALGETLRDLLRCGKSPRDRNAALFDAVTRTGSRTPIAPLLEVLTLKPAVFHQGNRGRDRARIEGEAALFSAVQGALDTLPDIGQATQREIHQRLRSAMLPLFPWLACPPVPRVSQAENIADIAKLVGLGVLLVFAFLIPGVLASLVLRPFPCFATLVVAGFIARAALSRQTGPTTLHLTPRIIGFIPLVAGGLLLFVVIFALSCAALSALHHGHIERFDHHLRICGIHFAFGAIGIVPTALALLAGIRFIEMRDPAQDAPATDPAVLSAMARREDKIAQNHMGSVVHVKPGVLRAILLPVALHALGLVLRIIARNGYLGSMRTIHFAHWAFTGNGARLMFFSNFDGSWESYLDDFIEKAHAGLTLAWSSSVGFPPTRFLAMDGATNGPKFKAWARHSMAESLFWFSAYANLTVNQIERQACIADGLREASLSEPAAAAWALSL